MHKKYEKEVRRLQKENSNLFTIHTLHVLNGQYMYDAFKKQEIMQNDNYIPFNEAMCVHTTTKTPFDEAFVKERACGHGQTSQQYTEKVIVPLEPLFNRQYKQIVLWFGEDMFCQMNVLTILAYLEQISFKGKLHLYYFQDDQFDVEQMELSLGNYINMYREVLVHHRKPSYTSYPIMDQAIELYRQMLREDNPVAAFIKQNREMSTEQLVKQLLQTFPKLGYGDTNYLELIHTYK